MQHRGLDAPMRDFSLIHESAEKAFREIVDIARRLLQRSLYRPHRTPDLVCADKRGSMANRTAAHRARGKAKLDRSLPSYSVCFADAVGLYFAS